MNEFVDEKQYNGQGLNKAMRFVEKALLLAEEYERISWVVNVRRSNECLIQYSATDNSSHSAPSMRRLTITGD